MIGTYAQVIALISYGNEYLQTGRAPENFYPGNSSFHYAKTVQFVRMRDCTLPFLGHRHRRTVFADNPLQWFYQLRQQGCKTIRLAIIASASTDPEIGQLKQSPVAGTWLIESRNANGTCNYWSSEWSLIKKGIGRRWNVTYTQVKDQYSLERSASSLNELTAQLQKVLGALIEFTKETQQHYWTGTFMHALAAFEEQDPCADYFHKDVVLLRQYPLAPRQLLFAAAKSWVFEGVGSWSDLAFSNPSYEALHKALTRELYRATSMALLMALNFPATKEVKECVNTW
jgi:hypothetical protein